MHTDSRKRVALLLGASGLVGRHCLDLLLTEPVYERVVALGRRSLDTEHPKLEQHTIDFDRPEYAAPVIHADDVFCCMGTTIKKAGSKEEFRRVDFGYPVEIGRIAARNGAKQMLIISSVGANPHSPFFYSRVKGEVEHAIQELPFRRMAFLRPSLLLGERQERRPGEQIAEILARPLKPLLRGPLGRYRPIEARAVAAALVQLAVEEDWSGVRVVESDQLQEIATNGSTA